MNSAIILATLLSIATVSISGQISFKSEYMGTSQYRLSEGETDEKVGNSKGSSIVHQGRVGIPLSTKINENNRLTLWSVGMGGAYASLKNKNFTEDLVIDKIMNLAVSVYHLKPLNDKWSIMASVGAGVYTSNTQFSNIRYDNVLGSGGVIFIRHLHPNLDLGGGVAMNNSFGYPMVFPAFYLNWNTAGKFKVRISMMEGLEMAVGYEYGKQLKFSLIAEMNGQMALLEKDGKDKIFAHQYIIVGLRPEITIGKHLSIPITAGINAMRMAEYNDRSLKSMFSDKSYYFQVSPYVSAGLSIGF